MTSDYYSVLGVSPAAEDVVIRAAYRALMRHYHPDTNPDPQAQERARAITAAFSVLGDPAKRAEYDARGSGVDLWIEDDIQMPSSQPPPPAMRGWGIASAALALALVIAVSLRPLPEPPGAHQNLTPRHTAAAKPQPIAALEPESERLAKLHRYVAVPPAPPELAPSIGQTEPADPAPKTIVAKSPAAGIPRRPKLPPAPAAAIPEKPKASVAQSDASDGCRPGGSTIVSAGCKNARVAALDHMAAGFFSQSMAHADRAKKELLMSSHTRSAETRGACRSDSCLSDAYLRQMREMSAIMEGRALPAQ